MSAPPAGIGGLDWSSSTSGAALPKKRTKIVFLNPTELSNWDDWKAKNEQNLIGETDLLQYEEMLNNKAGTSSSADACVSDSSKRKRRQKNSKNGAKKKVIDPSQPWLEDTDSDEANAGLEDELDDDEFFRRLEEEKLREDEEEARRKKEISEARALARARGTLGAKKGRVSSLTHAAPHTGRSVSVEASDSESFSEFGEGTVSSFGGSRADADEFDNHRSLYTHDEQDEEVFRAVTVDEKNDRSVLDDLPPPPSPFDRTLDTSGLGTGLTKLASDSTLTNLVPTDPHTLRMLAMDPIRLRYCSPPLHPPNSANDLVCPPEYLMDAFAIHEVLIRYGYLLRLSPFKIEDFLAALIANENSVLLAEVHMVLLRALLHEDEATGTWMYSIDCKESVNLSYHILDRYNWPYLLSVYLSCLKETEAAARASASSLSALSTAAAGPGGVSAALDSILTAAVFPEDLIPLDASYPFVPIRQRIAVLRGLVNLFLSSRPVRGDQLRDGFLTHEDHCRVCQQ
ncbi:unnamed protein product [Echinostoma caproni]|uniref:DDT domain-containing protein n=1 Tax=Echinostoma caproni TaxID=27848 RepID=A0A183B751_9TREM|nr:unnamed protein product [Echinostoma caproni]